MPKPVEKAEGKVVPKCRVIHGDCVQKMREMPENSIDAVVCDPPYGLSFMNKDFDKLGESRSMQAWHEAWAREVIRVLKPGGHLLAFGGTRTYHRLVCALEDAGFEIRDCIQWIYGSGFPKSLDVSKAIDKMAGAEREVVGRRTDRAATPKQDIRGGNLMNGKNGEYDGSAITAPATDAARQWEGWGSSLKPAHEPIVLARKPLSESSIARQVLRNGCGALNVDLTRVGIDGAIDPARKRYNQPGNGAVGSGGVYEGDYSGNYLGAENPHPDSPRHDARGRFPSNFLLSHVPGPNGCRRVGVKKVPNPGGKPDASESHANVYGWAKSGGIHKKGPLHADPDGMEEVESWSCAENCPVAELDRQSSKQRAGKPSRTGTAFKGEAMFLSGYDRQPVGCEESEVSGASRFFAQFPGEPAYCQETPESDNSDVLSSFCDDSAVSGSNTAPGFAYIPKAAARERWGILKCKDNNHRLSDAEPFSVLKPLVKNGECALCGSELKVDGHPTQKPQALMKYLCQLVAREGSVLLDPFCGSGSTGVACVELGLSFIGIEQDATYASVASRRIAHAQAEASSRLSL